ncbi:MAG: hypothetical protein EP330_25075 [Deltaproteobacteria bacterium]|nr:MAG: hypothetical protein EP330_25075 [Deltaproteobacteria bacterium]
MSVGSLDPSRWLVRDAPLAPLAAVATGEAAHRLARRLLAREDLRGLRVAVADHLLLVRGEDLPWVDGIRYLGRDPQAPRLLLPTTHTPPVHPSLLQSALGRPTAVSLFPPLLLDLGALGPVSRERLEAW